MINYNISTSSASTLAFPVLRYFTPICKILSKYNIFFIIELSVTTDSYPTPLNALAMSLRSKHGIQVKRPYNFNIQASIVTRPEFVSDRLLGLSLLELGFGSGFILYA